MDPVFGRLDQANLILKETFEGELFELDGPDGNTIECMFFACTTKEAIQVDSLTPIDGKTGARNGKRRYSRRASRRR